MYEGKRARLGEWHHVLVRIEQNLGERLVMHHFIEHKACVHRNVRYVVPTERHQNDRWVCPQILDRRPACANLTLQESNKHLHNVLARLC